MDNSGKPWNVVFGHHPVYSQGSHGDTDLVQQFIWNVLFEQEVDFYLSGHDHHLNALLQVLAHVSAQPSGVVAQHEEGELQSGHESEHE